MKFITIFFIILHPSSNLCAGTEITIYNIKYMDYRSVELNILKDADGFYYIHIENSNIVECEVISDDFKSLITLIKTYISSNKDKLSETNSTILLNNSTGDLISADDEFIWFFFDKIYKIRHYNSIFNCKNKKLSDTEFRLLIAEKLSYISDFQELKDLKSKINSIIEQSIMNHKNTISEYIGETDFAIISYLNCCICVDKESGKIYNKEFDIVRFNYPIKEFVYIDSILDSGKSTSKRCYLNSEDQVILNKIFDDILYSDHYKSLMYIDFPPLATFYWRHILYDLKFRNIILFYGSNKEFAEGSEILDLLYKYISDRLICNVIESNSRYDLINLIEEIKSKYTGIKWLNDYVLLR